MENFVPDILWLNLPLFILGLIIIIRGSDIFMDSSVWMARSSGIPQVVIGATIVSLCTTLPEYVSSCTAAYRGAHDMAMGNAVGSIICNTGLALGVLLFFATLRAKKELFLVRGIFMLGALILVLLLAMSGRDKQGFFNINRWDGGVLIIVLAIYLVVNYFETIHTSRKPVSGKAEKLDRDEKHWAFHLAMFLLGAGMVAAGAYLLIAFGQRIAANIGISESVVSLIFIAFGTSLPELFTAISAIKKKAHHISFGNVFGANILNMSLVIGSSSLISPLKFRDPLLIPFDMPVALTLGAVVFTLGLLYGRLGRKTGIFLLLFYLAYIICVLTRAQAISYCNS